MSTPAPVETVSTAADKAKLAGSVVLLVGGVAAFYLLGRELFSRRVGLAAALYAAVPAPAYAASCSCLVLIAVDAPDHVALLSACLEDPAAFDASMVD